MQRSPLHNRGYYTMYHSHSWLCFSGQSLETTQVKTAVDIDDLAGSVIEQPIGDGADSFSDIGAFAHATLRNQAGCDSFLVCFLHSGNHIGADNSRADFKHL